MDEPYSNSDNDKKTVLDKVFEDLYGIKPLKESELQIGWEYLNSSGYVIASGHKEENLQFGLWYDKQWERYDQVKDSFESYLKARGYILPADKSNFMYWFFKRALRLDNPLNEIIQQSHFLLYHEERLKLMNKPSKWEGLFNELSNRYIETTPEIFNDVMEYKRLPGGEPKILWLKYKVDAMVLLEYYNFTISEINDCYQSKNGVEFAANNRPTSNRKRPIHKIIEKFNSSSDN